MKDRDAMTVRRNQKFWLILRLESLQQAQGVPELITFYGQKVSIIGSAVEVIPFPGVVVDCILWYKSPI